MFAGWHEHIVKLNLAAGSLAGKVCAGGLETLDVGDGQLDSSLTDVNAHRQTSLAHLQHHGTLQHRCWLMHTCRDMLFI